jgi:predicted transcriptional regulator
MATGRIPAPGDWVLDFNIEVSYFLHVKDEVATRGDRLLAMLAALANPHRLRIIAALQSDGRNYVSQLAREIGISRPLLHLHLQKLEEAGLVTSQLELSRDGKALNFFDVSAFFIELTPDAIAQAAQSLTAKPEK